MTEKREAAIYFGLFIAPILQVMTGTYLLNVNIKCYYDPINMRCLTCERIKNRIILETSMEKEE